MGWMTRFEPATSGSTDRRSNQLSYIHHKSISYYTNFPFSLQNPRRCSAGAIHFWWEDSFSLAANSSGGWAGSSAFPKAY